MTGHGPGDHPAHEWRPGRTFPAIWAGFALIVVTASLALLNAETNISSHPVGAGGLISIEGQGEGLAVRGATTDSASTVGEAAMRSLTLGPAESVMVLRGESQQPVEQVVFSAEYTAAQPQPSQSRIDASLDAFVAVLDRAGYRGSIHIEATAFVLYRGTAPGFGTEIIVTASPATSGAHEFVARQQAASNQQTGVADSLPDLQQGAVLVGEYTAYGLAAGPQPHEWVAIQLDDEFYVVSVDHRNTETVIGAESMIALSASVMSQIRKLGVTTVEDHILDSQFGRENPQEASIMWTVFSTRCPPGASPTVCARPRLDSSD